MFPALDLLSALVRILDDTLTTVGDD